MWTHGSLSTHICVTRPQWVKLSGNGNVGFLIRSVPRACIIRRPTTVLYTRFPWHVALMKYHEIRKTRSCTDVILAHNMMASSNGNIFRGTGSLCGKSPVPGEFPAQRPVTRSFDVFFDPRPNKRWSKQSWGWWLETLSRSLWRHCNGKGRADPGFQVRGAHQSNFGVKHWRSRKGCPFFRGTFPRIF